MRKVTFRLFLTVCVSYLIIGVTSEYVLVSDYLLYDFWIDQLSYERISEMLEQGRNWKWLSYLLLPIILLLKLFLVSVCLTIGALIINFNKEFEDFFRTALVAEFIFLLPLLIKLFWFSLFQTNYSLPDLQYFYPLSALSLFNPQDIETYLIYPLQLINLFEVAYWILLAKGVQSGTNTGFYSSLGFVASSYGVGLLLWVIVVLFLTVNFS